jgi:hypothetical protein
MVKVTEQGPVFSLKTNVLYDFALTPNLALEASVGRNWSLSAGFMRGWWLERGWAFCWQVAAAELEARYWLHRNEDQPVLTGWFVGAFATYGFYDFQLESAKGVQGKLNAMGGISGGYTFALGGSWRLELTAGAGYLLSEYQRYTVAHSDGSHVLVKDGPAMRLKAFYPLKAGISLVWAFSRKREWIVNRKDLDEDKEDIAVDKDAATDNDKGKANEAP